MKKLTLATALIVLPIAALIVMSMAGNASQQLAAMVLAYWIIGIVGIVIAGLVLWLLFHNPES